jgi:hypothetical protein
MQTEVNRGLSLTGSTGTADTEGQHLHRHSAVALATVNVGVISEDVSDGLRSQVVRKGERHDGRIGSSLWCQVIRL